MRLLLLMALCTGCASTGVTPVPRTNAPALFAPSAAVVAPPPPVYFVRKFRPVDGTPVQWMVAIDVDYLPAGRWQLLRDGVPQRTITWTHPAWPGVLVAHEEQPGVWTLEGLP